MRLTVEYIKRYAAECIPCLGCRWKHGRATRRPVTLSDKHDMELVSNRHTKPLGKTSMVSFANWNRWLPWAIAAGDFAIVICTMSIAQFVRFGVKDANLAHAVISYWFIGVVLGVFWMLFLAMWRSWDIRIIASGAKEYLRVSNATIALFGGVAILAYIFKIELARGYVAIAVTIGLVSIVLWRWVARKIVSRLRKFGYLKRRLVIIGAPGESLQLYRSFARTPGSGFEPVGVVLPGRSKRAPNGEEFPLPVLGVDMSVELITEQLLENQVDVVAVTGNGLKPALRGSW